MSEKSRHKGGRAGRQVTREVHIRAGKLPAFQTWAPWSWEGVRESPGKRASPHRAALRPSPSGASRGGTLQVAPRTSGASVTVLGLTSRPLWFPVPI